MLRIGAEHLHGAAVLHLVHDREDVVLGKIDVRPWRAGERDVLTVRESNLLELRSKLLEQRGGQRVEKPVARPAVRGSRQLGGCVG